MDHWGSGVRDRRGMRRVRDGGDQAGVSRGYSAHKNDKLEIKIKEEIMNFSNKISFYLKIKKIFNNYIP